VLTQAEKAIQVENLRAEFGGASSVFVAGFSGITVEQIEKLRGKLHEMGTADYTYRVAKNSVLRRASEGSAIEKVADRFRGPTAVAISRAEPVTLAKVLVDFAKEHQGFELKGGVLGEKVLSGEDIATLATLPSLHEMRGKLVGLIQAPATKLARLLKEPAAQLARVLDARSKQG